MSVDALLASAPALPYSSRRPSSTAILMGTAAIWATGIFPLIYGCASRDVLIVEITRYARGVRAAPPRS